jgi:hypothetical protein
MAHSARVSAAHSGHFIRNLWLVCGVVHVAVSLRQHYAFSASALAIANANSSTAPTTRHCLLVESQGTNSISAEEADDMTCAICLERTQLEEIALVKGCEHQYCGEDPSSMVLAKATKGQACIAFNSCCWHVAVNVAQAVHYSLSSMCGTCKHPRYVLL